MNTLLDRLWKFFAFMFLIVRFRTLPSHDRTT